MKTHLKKGFTLIELLTVIAIIGILASILIPTVAKVRETARRIVDSSSLRQIGQAALIYANDHNENLPGPDTQFPNGNDLVINNIENFAAALALGGGLNDASIWQSASDSTGNLQENPGAVLDADRNNVNNDFAQADVSFSVARHLNMGDPSTTPIGWTSGLTNNGEWNDQSVYRGDGGHIVFLGGNVNWKRNLIGNNELQARAGEGGQEGTTEDLALALPDRGNIAVLGRHDGFDNLGLGARR